MPRLEGEVLRFGTAMEASESAGNSWEPGPARLKRARGISGLAKTGKGPPENPSGSPPGPAYGRISAWPSSCGSIGLNRIAKGWSLLIRLTVEVSLEPVQ